MGIRLVEKSVKLAMRSRIRFFVFTLMYTVLMLWMSYNFEYTVFRGDSTQFQYILLAVSIVSTVALSSLYAFIVINYRKRQIATLKCLGYTNKNINTIIITELLWVSVFAFVIVMELLIHITGVTTMILSPSAIGDDVFRSQTQPYLSVWAIVCTFGMFIISQVVGIILMYGKVLKLRPIVALRVMK